MELTVCCASTLWLELLIKSGGDVDYHYLIHVDYLRLEMDFGVYRPGLKVSGSQGN